MSTCAETGCGRDAVAKGLCALHYGRAATAKKMKPCACGCGELTAYTFKQGHSGTKKSADFRANAESLAELVWALFNYDPLTGVFTAAVRRGADVYVGDVAGHVNKNGYRVIKVLGTAYKAHRLALLYTNGIMPSGLVDHINGEKDDNRLCNLREADDFINTQNQRQATAASSSGLLGAHRGGWKGRRWVAAITHNKITSYLGIYETAEEAHAVYLYAKRMLHQGCTI